VIGMDRRLTTKAHGMKAVLAEKAGRLGVVEVGEPQPAADEALVEVRYIGVCGTDLHAYKGSHPFVTYPRVLGHEISGVLLAEPRDTALLPSGIKVGDPVIVEPYINCRTCHMCRAGRPNACLQLKVLGVHIDGAMTERIAVRADKVYRVSDGLSLRDAEIGRASCRERV
jgi:D-arabinose 1-dehydrogenase-like Zn-dependent alcohol dehydrogenase